MARVRKGDHVRILQTQYSTGEMPVGIVDNIDGYYFNVRVKVPDYKGKKEEPIFETYENELELITEQEYFKELLRGANG